MNHNINSLSTKQNIIINHIPQEVTKKYSNTFIQVSISYNVIVRFNLILKNKLI